MHDQRVQSSRAFGASRRLSSGERHPADSWRDSQAGREGIGYSMVFFCFMGVLLCAQLGETSLAVILTFTAIFALGIADLRGLLVMFSPTWALVGTILSLQVIESGAYMTEQGRRGSDIGATPVFCLYVIAFLSVAHLALTLTIGNHPRPQFKLNIVQLRSTLTTLTICLTIFYFVIFSIYGTGFSYSSRFSWAASLPGPVARLHWLLRSYIIPPTYALWGVSFATFGVPRQRRTWVMFCVPIAALMVSGERYSALAAAVSMVLTGIGVGGYLAGRVVRMRLRSVVVAGVAGLGLLANVIARFAQSGNGGSVVNGIRGRFALQGHVWFGIYDRFRGNPGVSIFELLRPNSLENPGGLDLLSYYVSDYSFVYDRITRGLTFTMGGPPGALASFGSLGGLVVYGLLGLLNAIAVALFVWFLRNRDPLQSLVALTLYALVGAANMMGNWSALYGPVAFACYFATWLSLFSFRPYHPSHSAKVLIERKSQYDRRLDVSVPTGDWDAD